MLPLKYHDFSSFARPTDLVFPEHGQHQGKTKAKGKVQKAKGKRQKATGAVAGPGGK
jgi:hypothetical protein